MRRLSLSLLLCSAMLISICHAADTRGLQADYKMTMTMNMDEMAKTMGAANPGLKLPSGQKMPKPQPVVTTGKTVWVINKSRTDTTMAGSKTTHTAIVDLGSKTIYTLMPETKTALTMDFSKSPMLSGLMSGGGGGPVSSYEDFATRLQAVRSMDGVTVKEIGAKKVNGYDAHGLSMTIDMAKFKDMLGQLGGSRGSAQNQQTNQMLASMGSMTVDMWISDEYQVPIKSISKVSGISTVYELTNIKLWTGPDSYFALPAGYAVKDMTQMMNDMTAGKMPGVPPVKPATPKAIPSKPKTH